MSQNIFSNQELNLKANIIRHFPTPIPFLITDTLFTLNIARDYPIKLGDQVTVQIGDGKGTTLSKIFYFIPTLPIIISFEIQNPEIANTNFIGISFTSNVDICFGFSMANQFPSEYLDRFRK